MPQKKGRSVERTRGSVDKDVVTSLSENQKPKAVGAVFRGSKQTSPCLSVPQMKIPTHYV